MSAMMRSLGLGFLLLMACADRPRSYLPLDGVALGGESFTGAGGQKSGSPDAPMVTLDSPAARVRGGSVWTAAMSISGKARIVAAQLQYARDGESITEFIAVDATQTTVTWTFEGSDVTGARLRLIAIDSEGRLGSAVTSPFTIDSTPPLAPAFSLQGASITNLVTVPLSIASCADAVALLVSDTMTALDGDEPAYLWQPCVTTPGRAGPSTVSLTAPDGPRPVRVWARDDVGNVSLEPTLQAVTLDTIAPVVTLVQPASGAIVGSANVIEWVSRDLHLREASASIEISADNGATFVAYATEQPTSGSTPLTTLAEGVYVARVRVADQATNFGFATSEGAFTVDATPPDAPNVLLTSATPTSDRNVALTVIDCTDRPLILVREADGSGAPSADGTSWQPCAQALDLFELSDDEGAHALEAWAQDVAGNVSTSPAVVGVTLDSLPPVLTLLAPISGEAIASGVPYQIRWSLTDANLGATPIILEESDNGGSTFTAIGSQPMANTGSLAWTVASASPDMRLRLIAVDLAGNQVVVSESVIVASDPPQHSAFRLNGETIPLCTLRAPDTTNPFALAELQIDDPVGANITHLCFKSVSATTPSANDGCFQPVNGPPINVAPAPSLHLVDVPVRLGFIKGNVIVRVWSKNAAGLVSGEADTECLNKRTILYDPGEPPVVSNVTTFSLDAPSDPYIPTDATLDAAHPNVFVKWNAMLPNGSPTGPTGPIQLDYTVDDFNYVAIAGTLQNSQGAGCTIDASVHTGCYSWTPPASLHGSYVKVRVRATDVKAISTVSSSVPPLNTAPIRFLAGNPDPGYGGNAASTVFVGHLTRSARDPRYGTLAVSARGVLYFLDKRYGIQWVDPATGNVETLVRITGTTLDAPVKVATADTIYRITMDHEDNLLFWDYNRIRRINVNAEKLPAGSATVTTIIGGPPGGARDTDYLGNNQDPITEVRVSLAADVLTALPDGDIYFSTAGQTAPNAGFALRHYVAGPTPHVDTISYSGNGLWSYYAPSLADDPINDVSARKMYYGWPLYDVTTSIVQRLYTYVWNDAMYGYGLATFDGAGQTTTPRLAPPAGYNVNAGFAIFTGMDGNIYLFDVVSVFGLFKYDLANNTWTRIAGGGVPITTPCQDSPPPDALSCRIDIQDVFIDSAGRIYWLSFGKVYTITEDNKILRIMGQGYDFGEGGPPLAARFGYLPSFDFWRDSNDRDRLVISDSISVRHRETVLNNNIDDGILDADENKIRTIAGNGIDNNAGSYFSYGLSGSTGVTGVTNGLDARTLPTNIDANATFALDRSNGFLYAGGSESSKLVRLRRDLAFPQWEGIVGGTGIPYTSAPDGTKGRDVSLANPPRYVYDTQVHGVQNGQALYHLFNIDQASGDFTDSVLKTFGVETSLPADQAITHFAGDLGSATAGLFCADGTPRETCHMPTFYNATRAPAVYDDNGGSPRWLLASNLNNNVIKAFPVAPSGPVTTLATLPVTRSFAFRRDGARSFIYYCDVTTGRIHRKKVEPTSEPAVALPWPVPTRGSSGFTIQCRGSAMRYNDARPWESGNAGTLMFSYEQYGLFGIAEYYDVLPP